MTYKKHTSVLVNNNEGNEVAKSIKEIQQLDGGLCNTTEG